MVIQIGVASEKIMYLNLANKITIARVLLIVPFVSCMLKINDAALTEMSRNAMRYAAIAIFLAMAFSDMLDGYLARKKNQVTKLGAFLDPMADKILMTSACLLLASKTAGVEGFTLPSTVVVLIIGKDLFLLIGFLVIYFITLKTRIVPIFVGKLATALQLAMVAGILIGPEMTKIVPTWIWLMRGLWWMAATTAILTTFVYIRTGSMYIEKHELDLNEQQ